MGGVSKEYKNLEKQIGLQQFQTFQDLLRQYQSYSQQRQELQEPYVSLLRGIIGGDKETVQRLLATPIADITRSAIESKERVYETVPSGAAREYALSQLARSVPSEISKLKVGTWSQAPAILSSLGSESGQYGLQTLGAGLRSGEAAAATISSLLQAEAAGKSSAMQILGELARSVGSGVARGF